MNFVSIEGRVLSAALRLHCAVIEKRNAYPILASVRLTVAGAVVKITGTDLDIEVTIDLDPIEAGGDWSVCINPRLLTSIGRTAGPEVVRIEAIPDDQVRITAGDVTYDLPTLSVEAFPDMGGSRGEIIEQFGNGSFAAMLDKVQWCISTEETRYYLNGVCWQTGPSGKRFIATDGHRAAVCLYDKDRGGAKTERIIHRKAVHILRRFAAGQDVTAFAVVRANQQGDLAEDSNRLEFRFGRTTLRTKLIEGTYPDVDRVLPKPDAQPFRFKIGKQALLSAVDRTIVVYSGRRSPYGGQSLRIHQHDGRLAIESHHTDTGTARVVTEADWPERASDFGLNAVYLRDILHNCQGMIEIGQKDAGAPFTVTDEDETVTRVIMPMRV